ncbi:unnamed protein product [Knipowitschia caucasica]
MSERDSSSVSAFIENILREGLKLGDSEMNIERAHRSLGPLPPNEAPPRSILVKFLSFKTKEQILHKAWQQKGFTWSGKLISLDNDYSLAILKKRKEYAEIRNVLKANQIKFQTVFLAKLKVKYTEGDRLYNTVVEVSEDMFKRGLPVEVIKTPESILEQVKQLTWNRATRGTGRRTTQAGPPDPSYKVKLRAFKRMEADATDE